MNGIKLQHTNTEYLRQVNDKIIEVLNDCPMALKPMVKHLLRAKGKSIRSALIVATAQANDQVSERIINLAAATEILHLSTLIHDDILDDAQIRRGIESLHTKFGKKLAVLCGDYLFTVCFRLISIKNRDRIEEFSKAVSAICVGEILQLQNNRNYDLTVKEYNKIIGGKTAAVFSMAMYGAAVESEYSSVHAESMARVGFYLGMIFQMIDDCLDFEGDDKKTRKNIFQDLEQGIVTYPLIKAMEIRPEIKEMLSFGDFDERNLQKVIAGVKESGALDITKEQAGIYYHRAKKKITKTLSGKNYHGIMEILDLAYKRDM